MAAAGCAARPGVGIATTSVIVPASSALVVPAPGTSSIVSVVQRQYTNAVEQQVALSTSAATSGQNFLSIQAFGPVETVAMPGGTLAFKPVRHSAIQSEIRTYFPGRALAISSNFVRNGYGPFGYAYGRGAGNDGCLYGWQQIRSDEADRNKLNSLGMIQIRLRVCEAGASEKDLVELMYGYTIVGGFAGATWNPYGKPAPVDGESRCACRSTSARRRRRSRKVMSSGPVRCRKGSRPCGRKPRERAAPSSFPRPPAAMPRRPRPMPSWCRRRSA